MPEVARWRLFRRQTLIRCNGDGKRVSVSGAAEKRC